MSENSLAGERKPPSSTYSAGVIGLTVLMACLVLAPEPIESYSAEALVRFTGAKGPGEGDLLVAEAELADWGRAGSATEGSSLEHRLEQSSPTSAAVRIVATNARSALAIADATEAAEALMATIPEAAAERLAGAKIAAQRQLETAEQHWNELQSKLDRLTRQRTDDLIESTRQLTLAKEQPAPPKVEAVEDPQRTQLEKTVAEGRSYVAELLRTHTDEHPQVIDAKLRLQEAESALAALPIRRRPEPVKVEPPKESAEAGARNAEFAAARQRLAKQIEAAEIERRFWRDELDRAAEQERTGKLVAGIAGQPQIVSRQGGTPSATRIMGYLLLAIASGLAMYGLAEKSDRTRRMSTLAEIEANTLLPIAAVLPGMRRIDKPEEVGPLRRMVHRTTSVCESGLALAAVVLLIASLLGQGLTVPPTRDPLGAFAEAVDRTLEPIRR